MICHQYDNSFTIKIKWIIKKELSSIILKAKLKKRLNKKWVFHDFTDGTSVYSP